MFIKTLLYEGFVLVCSFPDLPTPFADEEVEGLGSYAV